MTRRVMVIGLDCADPSLVFGDLLQEMPNLKGLVENGVRGPVRSCNPPITVPAWSVMLTSKNPGRLGFTGFRNLKRGTYDDQWIAIGTHVREPRVWDLLGRAGKRVIVQGVPQTYPPRRVNGCLVTSFLTPSTKKQFTYPPALKKEVLDAAGGEYLLDVPNFRTEDKDELLDNIYRMTEGHIDVATHLMDTKPWEFFMLVEMGPDRLHHGMWKYHDPSHRKHEPGNRYQESIRDYYRWLDGRIGELLQRADDNTAVMVVSDHGAKRMDGAINVNDWLRNEGYLTLKPEWEEKVAAGEPVKYGPDKVDWPRTRAWALGGYYSRVFVNKQGREPQGVVAEEDYEAVVEELRGKLEAIPDDNGEPMGTRVDRPEEVYGTDGVDLTSAPDLLVYFGDLHWRAHQSMGHGSVYSYETEIGPDDATHDWDGVFILYDPQDPGLRGEVEGLHIMDVAPTILRLYGEAVPDDMEGTPVQDRVATGGDAAEARGRERAIER